MFRRNSKSSHYRAIHVCLSERSSGGLDTSDQDAIDRRLEEELKHQGIGQIEKVLGTFSVHAPDLRSSNPIEHVEAVHFLLEVAGERPSETPID